MSLGRVETGAELGASKLTETLATERERFAAELRAGRGGADTARAFGRALIDALSEHATAVLERHDAMDGVALVAVGGVGRGLQFPHSDIDLVVVADGKEPSDACMRELLHPLWDARAQVNAVVRSPNEWLEQAVEDLTACTALLDMVHVAGEARVTESLRETARTRFFGDLRAHFLSRLNDEVRNRHERYGTTVYRVEPDLKYGPGGLRDLAAMDWALIATYQSSDLAELVERGVVGAHVHQILDEARDSLVRLRGALHIVAGRAQDRLVFRYQEAMPPVLGMTKGGPGEIADAELVAAIESFMQDYYRAANDVARHGVRVFAKCLPPLEGVQAQLRVDERFFIVNGRLHHDGEAPFEGRPTLVFDAIDIAQDYLVRISARTADAIAEALVGPQAEGLAKDPEAQRRFLSMLVDTRAADGRSALENAFDLGLLERMVPEFGASRGRMQHDSFHVYTVDQHSLFAVEFVKALHRGDHRKDYPLATALALGLDDLRPLCLATLLHDVGKPFGDQCVEGARIVREAAERAGLDAKVRDRLAVLVEEHLTMPLLSQKRDLSDPLLIEDFAAKVGDVQTLTELYLLVLADMATVSPDFLTSWKRTLLDELYLLTLSRLRAGHAPAPHADRPDEAQGLPERYYALFDVEMRRRHLALIQQMRSGDAHVVLDIEEGANHVRLTVVCRDRRGALADIAATLFELGVDVVAADIFSVPGEVPLVLDVFRIDADERHPMGAEFTARALDRLEARIRSAEQGRANAFADPSFDPGAPPRRNARALRAPTRVRFSEDPAKTRTLVDVETEQRPGALARITAAFAASGVDIQVARLSTEGRTVQDVFYVERLSEREREALEARLQAFLTPPE